MEDVVGGESIEKVDGTFKIHLVNIPRCHVATDAFKDPLMKSLSAEDLISAIKSADKMQGETRAIGFTCKRKMRE
jgi:hypothetical protein